MRGKSLNLKLTDIMIHGGHLRKVEPDVEQWYAAMKIFVKTFDGNESIQRWVDKMYRDRLSWKRRKGTA